MGILLPGRYLQVGRGDSYVNARRPWPPVRPWVAQQALKLVAAAQLDADVVIVADSDIVFVRPMTAERFYSGGQRLIYREEKGVTEDMDRHVIWHRVARELFGLRARVEANGVDDHVRFFHRAPIVVVGVAVPVAFLA